MTTGTWSTPSPSQTNLNTMGQYVARSAKSHIRLSKRFLRRAAGVGSARSCRDAALQTVQSFPRPGTHTPSPSFARILALSASRAVYSSRNRLAEMPRNRVRCSTSRSASWTSGTRQHSAHWRQSIAVRTSSAARRELALHEAAIRSSGESAGSLGRFFSPCRRICNKSVSI